MLKPETTPIPKDCDSPRKHPHSCMCPITEDTNLMPYAYTQTTLKPCPFCGDDVYLEQSGSSTSSGPDMMICHKKNFNCLLDEVYGGLEEKIVSFWNRRHEAA